MSTVLPVYVYGNGEMLDEVFNAIAAVMTSSAYQHLIHLALMFAAFMVTFKFVTKRDIMVKVGWLGQYFLIYSFLFLPQVSIMIIDEVQTRETAMQVDNIPLGIGVLAHLSTSIGSGLTELMEAIFSLPDDLTYHKSGMVMASKLVMKSSEFRITDPDMASNIQNFMQQCVFYDLYLEKYTLKELLSQPNLWSFVQERASPARAFQYKSIAATADTSPESSADDTAEKSMKSETSETAVTDSDSVGPSGSQILTCKIGAEKIATDLSLMADQAMKDYGLRIFGEDGKAELLKYLPLAYSQIAKVSDSATDIMKQLLVKNAFEDSVQGLGPTLNSSSAMESFAFLKAQQQKRLTNKTFGKMANHWLSIGKNVLEGVLYGAFIFVLLFAMLPGGIEIIKNYFISLLWIQLWAPLYAILNLIITMNASSASHYYAQGGLSLFNMSGLAQINADTASLAGWLSMSVPVISFYLLKFNPYTLTSIAQQLGGFVQSSATAASSEVASGNISMGNVSLGNANAYNSSSYHVDQNARLMRGLFSEQASDGSVTTHTPYGTSVIDTQKAMSNLPTNISFSDALNKSLSASARNELSTASMEQQHYSDSMSSTLQNVFDLSSYVNKSNSAGHGSLISMSARESQAFNTVHDMIEKTAKAHNIDSSELVRSLGNYHAGADASISVGKTIFGLGIKGEAKAGYTYSHDSDESQRQSESYSAAKELMQDKRFTNSLDVAKQATQTNSFNAQDEKGARLVDNMSSNFAKAQQLRQDVSAHLQKAQNYAEMANYAETHGYAINTNLNNDFVDWLSQQSGNSMQTGHMGLHAAKDILLRQPEQAQQYAMDYVKERSPDLVQSLQAMRQAEQQSIKENYAHEKAAIPSSESIQAQHNAHHDTIKNKALTERHLDASKPIDNHVKQVVQNQLGGISENIQTQHAEIKHQDEQLKQEREDRVKEGLHTDNKAKQIGRSGLGAIKGLVGGESKDE